VATLSTKVHRQTIPLGECYNCHSFAFKFWFPQIWEKGCHYGGGQWWCQMGHQWVRMGCVYTCSDLSWMDERTDWRNWS